MNDIKPTDHSKPFSHVSRKTGKEYFLNVRIHNGHPFYYFSLKPKAPVYDLPEGRMVVEAKNGVPMLATQ